MIRDIITVHDEGGAASLTRQCEDVPVDVNVMLPLFVDLLDTANWAERHHTMGCIGLSANQIGENYNAFVMKWGNKWIMIMNPEVLDASDKMCLSEEGCLSLPKRQKRKLKRHKRIKLQWIHPPSQKVMVRTFSGVDARVVQHEMDHAKGILI